jgi:uncharacterized protein (TIGR02246 family)
LTRLFVVVGLGILFLFAHTTAADKEKKTGDGSDEQAIRANIDSYVVAYNKGDAKSVAAHWSDSGEWVSPSGERHEGKEDIENGLRAMFADAPGTAIEVRDPTVRMLSAETAVERGTVLVRAPGEEPEESSYVAVHVKQDGRWKLDSVYETAAPVEGPANSPLQDLAWLVGDWVDTDPDADMSAHVTWTKNKSFLNYTFRVAPPGADDLEGTQVVGWDPAGGSIRSWMFDSDGGWGEGTWSKNGDNWVVKFRQVLPDGGVAEATNIYTQVDANTLVWKSIGRKLDGEFLPNIDDVTLVRKEVAALTEATPEGEQRSTVFKK